MNINRFTQKSLQAVQDCEKIAMDYGNQEIEHLYNGRTEVYPCCRASISGNREKHWEQ